ncbi:unnamed protein product [Ceratitis capitata]|uniref:(Mediterranean fruit fly) hypothetical protein n=1 Tax=Ceratitis capitata TaxID=7213 RepID=A0A811UPD4_CERCA|nr:unnamed protein product [Ceratitis capitata]
MTILTLCISTPTLACWCCCRLLAVALALALALALLVTKMSALSGLVKCIAPLNVKVAKQ